MKKLTIIGLFLLAITSTVSQDFVQTSDASVEIIVEGAPETDKPLSAEFGEPTAEDGFRDSSSFPESNQEALTWLNEAKWIWSSIKVPYFFRSPCFHNSCPRGKYTLYFSASCPFVIELLNQNGNVVQVIGSGNAWVSYAFGFTVPCGRHSIRIRLTCWKPTRPFIRYSWVQDRRNCFTCPDALRHTYNPVTCQCQCANTCACNRPQIFYKYPLCTCGCERSLLCSVRDTFWNSRTCACECLPKCCAPLQRWNTAACRCEWIA